MGFKPRFDPLRKGNFIRTKLRGHMSYIAMAPPTRFGLVIPWAGINDLKSIALGHSATAARCISVLILINYLKVKRKEKTIIPPS